MLLYYFFLLGTALLPSKWLAVGNALTLHSLPRPKASFQSEDNPTGAILIIILGMMNFIELPYSLSESPTLWEGQAYPTYQRTPMPIHHHLVTHLEFCSRREHIEPRAITLLTLPSYLLHTYLNSSLFILLQISSFCSIPCLRTIPLPSQYPKPETWESTWTPPPSSAPTTNLSPSPMIFVFGISHLLSIYLYHLTSDHWHLLLG